MNTPPNQFYSAPPPKSSKKTQKWILWLLVSFGIVCGICGFGAFRFMTHSGVYIDGKELTQAQVQIGKIEVVKMNKQTKKPEGLDESFVTSSPLSARFKELYLKIRKQESDRKAYNKEIDLDSLNKSMILSKSDLDRARQKFAENDENLTAYFDNELKITKQLQDLCVQVDGKESSDLQRSIQRLEMGKVDQGIVKGIRTQILDFLDRTPHDVSATGQAVFQGSSVVQEYNSLVHKLDDAVRKYRDHLKAGGVSKD